MHDLATDVLSAVKYLRNRWNNETYENLRESVALTLSLFARALIDCSRCAGNTLRSGEFRGAHENAHRTAGLTWLFYTNI